MVLRKSILIKILSKKLMKTKAVFNLIIKSSEGDSIAKCCKCWPDVLLIKDQSPSGGHCGVLFAFLIKLFPK